eukprot:CAMPEP_0184042488 /NCGR_PEP_ID=MMETSP0955-20130417/66370_1 /TAXON_ID=627963 /ORGANISM="Aplanochytrium sp, Strain PBS07" /LENGTH=188 /DNA_ID=CAMNT_0026333249 /DNA_START=2245 /DNA_END=2813 /DNA_ORIENTATION=-
MAEVEVATGKGKTATLDNGEKQVPPQKYYENCQYGVKETRDERKSKTGSESCSGQINLEEKTETEYWRWKRATTRENYTHSVQLQYNASVNVTEELWKHVISGLFNAVQEHDGEAYEFISNSQDSNQASVEPLLILPKNESDEKIDFHAYGEKEVFDEKSFDNQLFRKWLQKLGCHVSDLNPFNTNGI